MSSAMESEFDLVAAWTEQAVEELGPEYAIAAGCRGSGSPSGLAWLAEALEVTRAGRLLDAGSGVGGPAGWLAAHFAVVPVCADPMPGAVRACRRLFGLPAVVAAGQTLPFPDGAFDVALCQMALMFFPDRARVLTEMARVVGPDGTVAFSVPSRLAAQPAYAPFVAMAVRHAGPEAAALLGTYFASGDLDELRSLVEAAGLRIAAARTYQGTVRCPSIDAFVAAEVESTPLRERISDAVYTRIRDDAREVLRRFTKPDGAAEIPLEGHVIAARTRG
jgi:SAM-dependent methyltransferase